MHCLYHCVLTCSGKTLPKWLVTRFNIFSSNKIEKKFYIYKNYNSLGLIVNKRFHVIQIREIKMHYGILKIIIMQNVSVFNIYYIYYYKYQIIKYIIFHSI